MNRLKDLYQITKELSGVFDQQITSINRDDLIGKINKLIEQRSQYIVRLKPPYSEAEKIIGKEIVEMNKEIVKEMNELFSHMKKEMQHIRKQKKSNQSYVYPFKNVQSMDGMFMDSKN